MTTLAAIKRGIERTPDKILLYGVEGVGKSTFGASARAAVFIPVEDGIDEIDVPAFPRPKTYEEFGQCLATLYKEQHEYGTVVVDTLDALEVLMTDYVCRKNGWPDIEKPGYGKGYVALDLVWENLLDKLDKLRVDRGIEIVLLAHAAITNFNDPAGADYQRWTVKLHKRAAGLVKGWAKTILFAIHEQFADAESRKAVSTGKRIMHTTHSAAWDAKNRYRLPETLPLDYAAFATARDEMFKTKEGDA